MALRDSLGLPKVGGRRRLIGAIWLLIPFALLVNAGQNMSPSHRLQGVSQSGFRLNEDLRLHP